MLRQPLTQVAGSVVCIINNCIVASHVAFSLCFVSKTCLVGAANCRKATCAILYAAECYSPTMINHNSVVRLSAVCCAGYNTVYDMQHRVVEMEGRCCHGGRLGGKAVAGKDFLLTV